MGWNVNVVGKASTVASSAAKLFADITDLDAPSLKVKNSAAKLVADALSGCSGNPAVRVIASGQGTSSVGATAQTVTVTVEPVSGFTG